jgi:hypothetical protein
MIPEKRTGALVDKLKQQVDREKGSDNRESWVWQVGDRPGYRRLASRDETQSVTHMADLQTD